MPTSRAVCTRLCPAETRATANLPGEGDVCANIPFTDKGGLTLPGQCVLRPRIGIFEGALERPARQLRSSRGFVFTFCSGYGSGHVPECGRGPSLEKMPRMDTMLGT